MENEPVRVAFRYGSIEVVVEQLAPAQWHRTVAAEDEQVFAGTAPIFPDGAGPAAASALMTLLMRLASDAPMNTAVQAQVGDRAEDFRAMRNVLLRDPDSLRITK